MCPQIEKRMELVRLVLHNSHKKLASCLQGQLGTDAEKRHVRKRRLCFITEFKPAQGGFQLRWRQRRSGHITQRDLLLCNADMSQEEDIQSRTATPSGHHFTCS